MECNEKKGICSSCEHASKCSADEQRRHQEALLKKRLETIRHRIMVMSGKGGVGKSTVTANLANLLAEKGFKVGVLDADIHGPNIPTMLGVEGRTMGMSPDGIEPLELPNGLKVVSLGFLIKDQDTPVIWRGPLKMGVLRQFLSEVNWGELDFLFVDLPPGTGDEPLSIVQLIPHLDGAIVVTTPQHVALLDSRKGVSFCRKVNIKVVGIVENMSGLICPHCGGEIDLFKKGGGEKASVELGVPFLGRVPIDPALVEAGDRGLPFVTISTKSPSAQALNEVGERLLKFVGEK